MSAEPEAPDYRDVRRWCIAEARPLGPADLQRRFRIDYYKAAGLLEELERDLVLRRRADRLYEAGRPRTSSGRLQRDNAMLRRDRHPKERCEVCGWSIPTPARSSRASGCHDHHVIPVRAGGSDLPENRLLLCPNHHATAHALFPCAAGVYQGPRTRNGLLQALSLVDQAPADYQEVRAASVSAMLPRNSVPSPPPAPPRPSPPKPRPPRRLLSPSNVSPKILRLHLRHNHPGPIFDCPACLSLSHGEEPREEQA